MFSPVPAPMARWVQCEAAMQSPQHHGGFVVPPTLEMDPWPPGTLLAPAWVAAMEHQGLSATS